MMKMIRILRNEKTLDTIYYTSKDIFEKERKAIFYEEWHCIGSRSQIPAPGDCITDTIAGWPIIVLNPTPKRSEEGKILPLKAFHNVCRHRAGPLVYEGAHNCESAGLRCRYHGWLYDLDGRLKATPNFGDSASHIVKENFSLVPIEVREFKSLIFVRLRRDAEQTSHEPRTFESSMGPFIDALADRPIQDYVFHSAEDHVVQCKWKTYCENYGEGYHIGMVHPELFK